MITDKIIQRLTQVKSRQSEIVGLGIAPDRLVAVVLKHSDSSAVKDFVVKDIAMDQTQEGLGDVIKELFTQHNLFKKEVWLNIDLPESKMVFRRLCLPLMPDSEIANAIRWGLKDKVSIDVKDAQLAYEIIGHQQREDGSMKIDLAAVLIDKSEITRYLDLFKKIDITLSGISVAPFSISNLLKADIDLAQKPEPVLICHIGMEYTYLCVYIEGKLQFVRQLPVGLISFINAMTGVLVSDKGRVELTLQDAKGIIQEFGIPSESDRILDDKVAATQVIAMVRPVIERFVNEVSLSIDYYQKELKGSINKILLTGEGSAVKGLDDFVSKELGIDVGHLKTPKGLLCPAALGAGLGPRGGINLLPDELKQKKQEEMKKTVLRLSTTAILGVLFFSFLTVSVQIKSYKRQLGLIQNQKIILEDLKDMQDKIASRQAIASSIREREIPVDIMLKELSVITPGCVAFSELRLSQKEGSLKLGGKISTRPETVQKVISDFMEELERSPFIKEANLSNIQKEGQSELSIFEINCVLEERSK
jgi:type IV pilus assembly protein PilM